MKKLLTLLVVLTLNSAFAADCWIEDNSRISPAADGQYLVEVDYSHATAGELSRWMKKALQNFTSLNYFDYAGIEFAQIFLQANERKGESRQELKRRIQNTLAELNKSLPTSTSCNIRVFGRPATRGSN